MHLLALCACLWAVFLGLQGEAKAYELKAVIAVLENDKWPEGIPPRAFVRSVVAEAKRLHSLRSPIPPSLRFRVRFYKDPLGGAYNKLDEQNSRMFALIKSRLNKRLTRSHAIVHYVVSPMVSPEGRYYIGGVAREVCTLDHDRRDRVSIGNMLVNRVGNPDLSFFTPSAVIIAHELGHTLGMYHVETPTLMHPSANALWLLGILEMRWQKENLYDARYCYQNRDSEFPDPTAQPIPATPDHGCVFMAG